tara:strand:- start:7035 stop:7244 length:210 start_codon:yes stop_codon:yes gene_type:complete
MSAKIFEVGQPVTIDSDDYLKNSEGIILDVSSSHGGVDTMYTVDVEEHGTHFFFGGNLASTVEVGAELV